MAKVACATCHQGAYKPLYGKSMLKDYPELAAPGPGPDAAPSTDSAPRAEEQPTASPAPRKQVAAVDGSALIAR